MRTPGRENSAKFKVEGYGMFEEFIKVLFRRNWEIQGERGRRWGQRGQQKPDHMGPHIHLLFQQLFANCLSHVRDFPGGSDGKASAYNVGDLCSIPSWEDLLEKEMATHSSILAWKIPWREEPGTVHRVAESDMTEWLHFHLLHVKSCYRWLGLFKFARAVIAKYHSLGMGWCRLFF